MFKALWWKIYHKFDWTGVITATLSHSCADFILIPSDFILQITIWQLIKTLSVMSWKYVTSVQWRFRQEEAGEQPFCFLAPRRLVYTHSDWSDAVRSPKTPFTWPQVRADQLTVMMLTMFLWLDQSAQLHFLLDEINPFSFLLLFCLCRHFSDMMGLKSNVIYSFCVVITT